MQKLAVIKMCNFFQVLVKIKTAKPYINDMSAGIQNQPKSNRTST